MKYCRVSFERKCAFTAGGEAKVSIDNNCASKTKCDEGRCCPYDFWMYFTGETMEDIQAQIDQVIKEEQEDGGIEVIASNIKPLTTQEYIEIKEEDLKSHIKSLYRNIHDDPEISIREYSKLIKSPDEYCKALDYFLAKISVEKTIQKKANLERMNVKQYNDFVERLMATTRTDEFQAILEEIKSI